MHKKFRKEEVEIFSKQEKVGFTSLNVLKKCKIKQKITLLIKVCACF